MFSYCGHIQPTDKVFVRWQYMSESKIDGIILEIETTTDKSDGGLDKTIKFLENMKKITGDIDANKLKTIKTT